MPEGGLPFSVRVWRIFVSPRLAYFYLRWSKWPPGLLLLLLHTSTGQPKPVAICCQVHVPNKVQEVCVCVWTSLYGPLFFFTLALSVARIQYNTTQKARVRFFRPFATNPVHPEYYSLGPFW